MFDVYLKKSIPTQFEQGMDFSWTKIYGYLDFSIEKLRGCQDKRERITNLGASIFDTQRSAFHAAGDAAEGKLGERVVADRLTGLQLQLYRFIDSREFLIGQIVSSSSQF